MLIAFATLIVYALLSRLCRYALDGRYYPVLLR